MALTTSVGFRSPLAKVLLATQPEPGRAAQESQITFRLLEVIGQMTAAKLFRRAAYLDALFIPKLSGANMLAVAQAIEEKSPAAIEVMPTLSRFQVALKRAHEQAMIVSPEALQRLIRAIEHHEKTQGGGHAS